ncbi:hypothetical protein Prudu_155S000300 [Prunus dulcis]|uniref:Terpene synthase metal-binding domain-containing protein n=1 Tax=Prunus dulcis TaxID=3755 RepID=A0A5H2XK86_PRUDU|nr:hypothetical protein Prudu_155S000300 [Prunus dulcis]
MEHGMSCIEKLQCQCVWHAKLVRSNTSKGVCGEDILEEALVPGITCQSTKTKLHIMREIVELYFWTTGRKILNKVIALGTVMDDIYDAFGTFEELEIFTEAIRRTLILSKQERFSCFSFDCFQFAWANDKILEIFINGFHALFSLGCFVKAFGRMDAAYFLQGYYLYVLKDK